MKKMELTDADEQALIEEVFSNAVTTLGDDDRELPQAAELLFLFFLRRPRWRLHW